MSDDADHFADWLRLCEELEEVRTDLRAACNEIDRLHAIMHLQNDEIKMLRARLCADAPFDAVEDYKQFRRDNPDTVTVDE
jgi:hypothetical protein